MPWSNQGGGGGGWKGGNNGPWGQPPRGPSGGGNEPPDLEELLKRGQDQIRRLIPGGNRRGPSGGGEAAGVLAALPLIVVALFGFWLYESIYVVQPDEVGIVLRFGKVKPELNEPGIHFALWPIETVEKPALLKENQEVIGGSRNGGESIMLSGDQNLVNVEFSVLWRISDPVQYLFRVQDQPDLVRMVSESVMREVVGRTRADEFRTTGREVAQIAVRERVQETLDHYQAGVSITAINVTKADPPVQVADAFGEVQRAQQDQDKFKQDAQAYANKRLGEARGEASQIREGALGYRDQVIAEATGAAQRFTAVREQYEKAPDVTRERIYLETVEGILSKTNKVVVDGAGTQGILPYLPLPALKTPSPIPTTSGASQ